MTESARSGWISVVATIGVGMIALLKTAPDLAGPALRTVGRYGDDIAHDAGYVAGHAEDATAAWREGALHSDDAGPTPYSQGGGSRSTVRAGQGELPPMPHPAAIDAAGEVRRTTVASPGTTRRFSFPLHDLDHTADLKQSRPATYEVFMVAPEDQAQAQRIFMSSADPKYLERALEDSRAARASLGQGVRNETSAYGLRRQIETSDSSYIVVIGHNQNGKLIFADGSVFDLRTLSNHCKELDKFCVLLSCKSKYVGAPDAPGMRVRLTYRDAAAISKQVERILAAAKGRKMSPGDMERRIHAALTSSDLAILSADALRVTFIPAAGLGVGAMLISVDPE